MMRIFARRDGVAAAGCGVTTTGRLLYSSLPATMVKATVGTIKDIKSMAQV
jgi:hypothetical protein